jgi:hypothetical protein
MSEAYERAKEEYKDFPRPSIEEFIAHSKNAFNTLGLLFGEGFVIQAVEIAEQLQELKNGNS